MTSSVSLTHVDLIKATAPTPVASFIATNIRTINDVLMTQFTDTSIGDICDWEWDFGTAIDASIGIYHPAVWDINRPTWYIRDIFAGFNNLDIDIAILADGAHFRYDWHGAETTRAAWGAQNSGTLQHHLSTNGTGRYLSFDVDIDSNVLWNHPYTPAAVVITVMARSLTTGHPVGHTGEYPVGSHVIDLGEVCHVGAVVAKLANSGFWKFTTAPTSGLNEYAEATVSNMLITGGVDTNPILRVAEARYSKIQHPTHTYVLPGTYNVSLAVKDRLGRTSTHTVACQCTNITTAGYYDVLSNNPHYMLHGLTAPYVRYPGYSGVWLCGSFYRNISDPYAVDTAITTEYPMSEGKVYLPMIPPHATPIVVTLQCGFAFYGHQGQSNVSVLTGDSMVTIGTLTIPASIDYEDPIDITDLCSGYEDTDLLYTISSDSNCSVACRKLVYPIT